ncbi:DapH/DapD/GlmU-related protein [Plebeiibacterium sediminum]|uniref:DapH/DapD/GlmU-related protein n=1 Tax=Plebeiibacterium sediminum TaxID=2992112 RepID=A0AAE3M625_9BACT|nr:DapH/DapD/GlmU-related protein [Plebeiobacterium sediminum]MCW3787285.1 DapH/DapD/GlmU-related protein [Plebeiobacterium sediminum]
MNKDVFQRLQSGEVIPYSDPAHHQIAEAASRTNNLLINLNATTNPDSVRKQWSNISGNMLDVTSTIKPPVFVNIGLFTRIGKNVCIDHSCSLLDMGTITIEDDVLIGPKVNIVTEEHPVKPSERRALGAKPVIIKRNATIGAGATILPGITVGENAVVTAGSVVTKDVSANTVVAGIPAKVIEEIN